MRQIGLGLALVALGLALAVPVVWGQGGTVSSSYMQTFDGAPARPTAYRPPGWDVQVHSRDLAPWTALEGMDAQHGEACEAPPAHHHLAGAYEESVFQCSNHMMTAMLAEGYGVIYLTPPALADLSQGETVIRWDMSTWRTSFRDWMDVWIGPPDDHLALPLEGAWPDLAGQPRNGVHVNLTQDNLFYGHVFRDGVEEGLPLANYTHYDQVLTPSMAVRTPFEIHLSRTHLRAGMPQQNIWWLDADIADLGWDQGVVQFGHHSYNPQKDCGVPPPTEDACYPGTFHWDNVGISPSVPLQITALSPRQIREAAPGGWTFPAPAPAGAILQFAANNAPGFTGDWANPGTPQIDLSWDGGATWQTVAPQWSDAANKDPMGARSYWVPVPTGVRSVQVRGQGGWWGSVWSAQDASLWQITPSGVPPTPVPPTALPTVRPNVTATVPPTSIPIATDVPTPNPTAVPATWTPAPTNTSLPTSTPLPTATSTAVAATATPGRPARGYPTPNPARPCAESRARFGTPPPTPWVGLPASQCR